MVALTCVNVDPTGSAKEVIQSPTSAPAAADAILKVAVFVPTTVVVEQFDEVHNSNFVIVVSYLVGVAATTPAET